MKEFLATRRYCQGWSKQVQNLRALLRESLHTFHCFMFSLKYYLLFTRCVPFFQLKDFPSLQLMLFFFNHRYWKKSCSISITMKGNFIIIKNIQKKFELHNLIRYYSIIILLISFSYHLELSYAIAITIIISRGYNQLYFISIF